MKTWMLVVAGCVITSSAWAQGSDAARWNQWLGCWTVSVNTTRGPSDVADGGPSRAPRARVCVTADGDGADITTEVDGKPALTQRLVADGAPRPFTDGACSGTQQLEWSSDGRRLFSRAQLTCAAGATRAVTGISLLAPDGTWIEAQAMDIAGRSSVRVRRFVREDRSAAVSAPRLTVDEVTEASAHVAAPALEAALVESRATFALTAARLIEMAEAGVPPGVTDTMVALTYPQSFALRPAARADRLTPFPFDVDASDPTYPWWLSTMGGGGGYFDSAYFMSPFGYSYLSTYPVVFGVGGADGGGRPARAPRGGRVVNGLGYTRLAPRDAQTPTADGGGGASPRGGRGTVSPQGYTRGAEASSGSTSSSSGGSGSGSSSSGGAAAPGSGSSDGGRTAVDR